MTPLEVRLFDAAWALVTAVAGGGPLPHKTPEEAADAARPLLLALLDERNAYGGGTTGYRRPAREAACDVLIERLRQIAREGWTPVHDDKYELGQLARAAAAYAAHAGQPECARATFADEPPALLPWDGEWWKPKDPRADLVRAGALILAEIERLDRKAAA